MFTKRELELLLKHGTFDIFQTSSGWMDGTEDNCPACEEREDDFTSDMKPITHLPDCYLEELKALKKKIEGYINNGIHLLY